MIGNYDEDVENDGGRRLLRFSAKNEMKMMNTHFDHKQIHKFTWKCPGRGLQSIIDYFLVRGDLRREVHNYTYLLMSCCLWQRRMRIWRRI